MGDRIRISENSGTIGDVGSRRSYTDGAPPSPDSATNQTGTPAPREARIVAHRPGHGLYAFADIVGYSKLNVRLQKRSQDDLVGILNWGISEAGLDPAEVEAQDHGDARMLTFAPDADAGKVLAAMPRAVNDELAARNADMAEHTQVRVRMAFAMGASLRAAAGRAGDAPIAAARMADSDLFRQAMRVAPRAQCGLLIDEYLYRQCVSQGFRADIGPGEFAQVRISIPGKGFDEKAWLKLFGYSGRQVIDLLSPASS